MALLRQVRDRLRAASPASAVGRAVAARHVRVDGRLDPLADDIDADTLRDLVLITGTSPVEAGRACAQRYPDARIHVLCRRTPDAAALAEAGPSVVVRACADFEAMHLYLLELATAPQVLIEDGTHDPRRRVDYLRELMFHLADGGLYVAENDADGSPVREVLTTLRALAADPELGSAQGKVHPHNVARARAVRSVVHRDRLTLVRIQGDYVLKLRDALADDVLTLRHGPAWGATITTLPAQTFAPRSTLWTNRPERTEEFRGVLEVPELHLREYHDVVCAPRAVALLGDAMLPISFHHGLRPQLQISSPLLHDANRWYVVPDVSFTTPVELPGIYYHLDSEFPFHFGHWMTEDIAKLWGWAEAKALHPDLKALISTFDPKTKQPGTGPKKHQLALLEAYGIPNSDVVCIDRPTRVRTLLGATQMFYNPLYVHPDLAQTWDALREGLRTPAAERPATPSKIFVSRGRGMVRPCRNAAEVEGLFAEHGFEIVQPEKLDLRRQVDLFAGADVVAGFGGSGMFNTIYCERPGTRIVIASTEYRARNEYNIAALKGDDYHHFYCEAEIHHPKGKWVSKAFHSPYTFDFDTDGPALEALLNQP